MNLLRADFESAGRPASLALGLRGEQILRSLNELRDDPECAAQRRRACVDTLVARVNAYREAAALSGLDDSRGLEQLHRQVIELECTPASSQRFDHRLQRLDWALRRFVEENQGRSEIDAELA